MSSSASSSPPASSSRRPSRLALLTSSFCLTLPHRPVINMRDSQWLAKFAPVIPGASKHLMDEKEWQRQMAERAKGLKEYYEEEKAFPGPKKGYEDSDIPESDEYPFPMMPESPSELFEEPSGECLAKYPEQCPEDSQPGYSVSSLGKIPEGLELIIDAARDLRVWSTIDPSRAPDAHTIHSPTTSASIDKLVEAIVDTINPNIFFIVDDLQGFGPDHKDPTGLPDPYAAREMFSRLHIHMQMQMQMAAGCVDSTEQEYIPEYIPDSTSALLLSAHTTDEDDSSPLHETSAPMCLEEYWAMRRRQAQELHMNYEQMQSPVEAYFHLPTSLLEAIYR